MSESDSIRFRCPHCDRNLRVPAKFAGKRAPCPKCAEMVSVPESEDGEDEVEPAPARPIKATAVARKVRPQKREEEDEDEDDEDDDTELRRSKLPWILGVGGTAFVLVVAVVIALALGGKKRPVQAGTPEVAASTPPTRATPVEVPPPQEMEPEVPPTMPETKPEKPPKVPDPKTPDDPVRFREYEQKLVGTWTFSAEGIVIVMGLDKGGKVTAFILVVNQGTGSIDWSNDQWHYKIDLGAKSADLLVFDGKEKTDPREKYGIESIDGSTMKLSRFDIRVNRFVTQSWKKLSEDPLYSKKPDKEKPEPKLADEKTAPLTLFNKVIASAAIPKSNADEVARIKGDLEVWQKAIKAGKATEPVAIFSDRETYLCPHLTLSVVEKALGKPDRKETGTIPFLLTPQGEKVGGSVLWYGPVGFCFGEMALNKKKDIYLFMMKYEPK